MLQEEEKAGGKKSWKENCSFFFLRKLLYTEIRTKPTHTSVHTRTEFVSRRSSTAGSAGRWVGPSFSSLSLRASSGRGAPRSHPFTGWRELSAESPRHSRPAELRGEVSGIPPPAAANPVCPGLGTHVTPAVPTAAPNSLRGTVPRV